MHDHVAMKYYYFSGNIRGLHNLGQKAVMLSAFWNRQLLKFIESFLNHPSEHALIS